MQPPPTTRDGAAFELRWWNDGSCFPSQHKRRQRGGLRVEHDIHRYGEKYGVERQNRTTDERLSVAVGRGGGRGESRRGQEEPRDGSEQETGHRCRWTEE